MNKCLATPFRFALVAMLCCVSSSPVYASLLAGVLQPFPALNTIEDTDVDRLVKGVNPTTGAPNTMAGILEVGDFLETIANFPTLNSQNLNTQIFNSLTYQLTAVSRIQVTSKTATATPGLFDFEFGNALGTSAIRVFENPVPLATEKYDQTVDPDGATGGIARASSGELVLDLALSAADDFWQAVNAADNINVFSNPGNTQGGDFAFGLTQVGGSLAVLSNGVMDTSVFGPGTLHDVVGNGNLKNLTGTEHPDWDVVTNTLMQFRIAAAVPEPMSLFVWTVLVGLGFFANRRESRV